MTGTWYPGDATMKISGLAISHAAGPQHSKLLISSYPKEKAEVSGGQKLQVPRGDGAFPERWELGILKGLVSGFITSRSKLVNIYIHMYMYINTYTYIVDTC